MGTRRRSRGWHPEVEPTVFVAVESCRCPRHAVFPGSSARSTETLHGATAGIITPAIAAISLGLVGRRAMSMRTGRNYRYAAAGNAVTAAVMGFAGAYIWDGAIFLTAAVLCVPALVALSTIRGDDIDYARARNAAKGKKALALTRVVDLAKNRRLLLFSAAVVMFQFADAAMAVSAGITSAEKERAKRCLAEKS